MLYDTDALLVCHVLTWEHFQCGGFWIVMVDLFASPLYRFVLFGVRADLFFVSLGCFGCIGGREDYRIRVLGRYLVFCCKVHQMCC